jgi:hypothetical protein
MKNKMVHIISDPIHGAMRFTHKQKEIVKKIIDDRTFQRLRRIKQLGCGDLLFPGAVHTRFNHMIGVCYLAKRLCVCRGVPSKLCSLIPFPAFYYPILIFYAAEVCSYL